MSPETDSKTALAEFKTPKLISPEVVSTNKSPVSIVDASKSPETVLKLK